ncbi:MAG: metalloregulator ArsR/SmtB family transcription factor [Elusimicrobium sp.]|jgi:ArsR family transcriptional regulator|nr:metalloregulator ArsR/SmtB family transcription factor [Elusimicrobium sp.]
MKTQKLNITGYCAILKALAHPVRLKIVCGLSKKGMCNVGGMAERLGIAQPAVSQHLNILKNAGVVTGYRKGVEICYKVQCPEAVKIIQSMDIDFCKEKHI